MKLIVFYDNWCSNCSKFAITIESLDWFGIVSFVKLRDESVMIFYPNIDLNLAEKQMISLGHKIRHGYDSLFYIFLRIPLFWIIIPFLFLLKISSLGQILYTQLALKRKIIPLHCDENTCKI